MTTLLKHYQTNLQRADFVADAVQESVVHRFQQFYDELIRADLTRIGYRNVFSKLLPSKSPKIRGFYLWGGVGRGKTYLVDNFYHYLPINQKKRFHFHHFMRFIHHELKQLTHKRNPLLLLADQIAKQTRIIYLDEFHVADITDAMLLSGLLKALFDRQVILIMTSNIAPDDLYQNGLQRERFLPAIELIKENTDIIHLDSGVDYRFRHLGKRKTYYCPLTNEIHQQLLNQFEYLALEQKVKHGGILEINGRQIPTVRYTNQVVWFQFQALCDIPRAVADYIELAKRFSTIIISDIHGMNDMEEDKVLRLINLIDEFYEYKVKLIISATVPAEQLYTGQRQYFQFQRTLSRLQEMSSHLYWENPHST
jgi:cell division protein ZapE